MEQWPGLLEQLYRKKVYIIYTYHIVENTLGKFDRLIRKVFA